MFPILNSSITSKFSFKVSRTIFYRSKSFQYRSRKSFRSNDDIKTTYKPRNFPPYDQNDRIFSQPKDEKKKFYKARNFPLYAKDDRKLAPKVDTWPFQKFDYFLILDFEATCDSPINVEPPEIIEFPVLKVNGKTFITEATFHSYVRPEINPELSSFCTELTGIIQSMIDDQPVFKDVFQNFMSWMANEKLLESQKKFAFVTCGDPDLDYILPVQCKVSDIEVPDFMKKWINIKRSFCEIEPYTWPDNLTKMLQYCELEPLGELHSGLDDSKNVARILKDLAERGLVFDFNGWKKN